MTTNIGQPMAERDPTKDPKPGDVLGFDPLREGSKGPRIEIVAVCGNGVAIIGGFLLAVTWITLDNFLYTYKNANIIHRAD